MNSAPIVLFVYNRPWHTMRTVECLQKNRYAEQSELIIYADGPKEGEADAEIRKVRDYLRKISGFKRISITERNHNFGLASSVIEGATEVIDKYGKAIVLEDDLELSPDFLRFMNAALDRYNNDNKVMQISGHMFNLSIEAETDAVFLPFTNSWGWATWKRAWDLFDPTMEGYKKIITDKNLIIRFNLDGALNFFEMLESQINGKLDSWAIRWYLDVFLATGMALYPVKSLVKHIGFGNGATHCRNSAPFGIYANSCAEMDKDFIKFPDVSINEEAYQKIKSLLSSQRTIAGNFKLLFRKFLKNNGRR